MTDQESAQMRVLVTNDDGVASPGLHALVRWVADAGYDVVVAAPSSDMSGSGASIGRLHLDRHVDAHPVDLPGAEDVETYAVDGPPGLCVLASRLGGFGDPPDLVVSGINPGCNTGRSVLHSGTVGAVLSAANFGCGGVAVSIEVAESSNGREEQHWETAAELGTRSLRWLVKAPRGTVLNVNVPNLPLEELRGARWAELAEFGTVRSAVVESATGGGGRLQMELAPVDADVEAGSDTALVQAGYVAVTTLSGITAADPIDVGPVVGMEGVEGEHPR